MSPNKNRGGLRIRKLRYLPHSHAVFSKLETVIIGRFIGSMGCENMVEKQIQDS